MLDTASWPRGGIALPPTHRDGDATVIQYGKGSANGDAARATPLRASTLPPHQFLVDAAAAVGGDDDDLGRSNSTTTSGVASLRVGALTPLCPGTFNYFSPFFCVKALWPGQEESEAWPPLPVPLSSSSSSPSSLPPLSSSSFELRAPVVSRRVLDSYFSSCGRLRLRVLPFFACGERGGGSRESDGDGDDDCFLAASLPLVPGGRCDDDDDDDVHNYEELSLSSPSPVATLSVSLRISVAGLERSVDGELDVAKRRRRRAAEAEATTATATAKRRPSQSTRVSRSSAGRL